MARRDHRCRGRRACRARRMAGAGRADRDRRFRRRRLAHPQRARLDARDVAAGRAREDDRLSIARAWRRDAAGAPASSIWRTRSWSAAPRRWCSTWFDICRSGSSRSSAVSIEAGPIGEEIRKTGVPFQVLRLNPGLRRPLDVLRDRATLCETCEPTSFTPFCSQPACTDAWRPCSPACRSSSAPK